MYIAIVSTTVETNDPMKEIGPGLALLGNILERLVSNNKNKIKILVD
jgi:RAB protein geranylgeranyltransferase component A